MIAIIIIILAVVIISACVGNGEWGPAALTAVIAIVLLAMGAIERKDVRAWMNRRNYWADGTPPDWKENRRRARTYESPRASASVSRRERKAAAAKREAYAERLRNGEETLGTGRPVTRQQAPSGSAAVCHYCGRYVRVSAGRVITADGMMREFVCPKCGKVNLTKVGT